MDYRIVEYQQENLKRLLVDGIKYARIANNLVLNNSEKNKYFSMAYLQKSISKMCACESLYYSSYETLAQKDIENIFKKFDIFSDTFLKNYEKNRLSQDIYNNFLKLQDCFLNSTFNN